MKNKIKTTLLCVGIGICIGISSCSKNENNSKVSVAEDHISVVTGDSTVTYKIEEINYSVVNDTTFLEITALKDNSSTDYIVVGLRNIVSLSEKKYTLSRLFETDPDSSSAYLFYINSNTSQTQVIEQGELNVLKYQYNNVFQASFTYSVPGGNDSVPIKGEINLNFAHYDANRIPNVPLAPGKLRIKVDSVQQTLSCVASYIASTNQYVINGVYNRTTLVVEIRNIDLIFNKEYPIGQAIDSTGYIQISYSDSTGTYLCDGKNRTSGKLTIAKITYNTLQGYLEGTAYNSTSRKNLTLTDGIFFARLKRIE